MKKLSLSIVLLISIILKLNAYGYGTLDEKIKGCKNNNAEACYELGSAYKRGLGISKNKEKSLKFYNKALRLYKIECNDEVGKSCKSISLIYSMGLFVESNKETEIYFHNKAYKIFKKECNNNKARACYQLGLKYYIGYKVKEDYNKALILFKKSCKLGTSMSCLLVKDINIKQKL